jgi:uncharacterized membrane protein YeaQ/YmgE (transglycosylase-associated protein family)
VGVWHPAGAGINDATAKHKGSERPLVGGETVTVTGIITALIIGLIVGALGRLVVPGRQNIPMWLTLVIGVVAALIGTVVANAIGISTNTPGVDWGELLIQVLLAAIGVGLVVGVSGRRTYP